MAGQKHPQGHGYPVLPFIHALLYDPLYWLELNRIKGQYSTSKLSSYTWQSSELTGAEILSTFPTIPQPTFNNHPWNTLEQEPKMPDKDSGTPRVFLYRHGQTEWSKNGRYTGITELELTQDGINQVTASGKMIVGSGRLIDPAKLAHVYISPRRRAMQTFEIAFSDADKQALKDVQKISETDRLAEWDYGLYEGLLTKEIRALRKEHGLDTESEWDIWRDGCENGESAQEVTDRLDNLIQEIRAIHKDNMHGENPSDILLVAHGHLLRAFTKRWLGYPMEFPLSLMLDPGAVGVLSYQHHNIDEPAMLVGYGYPLQE